jgi:hypothetical protein
MAFKIPTFNLLCNLYTSRVLPPAVPRLRVRCQLRTPRHTAPAGSVSAYPVFLILPALTDVRDLSSGTSADAAEVPAGSGRFYEVLNVDDVAKGFANEYRLCLLIKIVLPKWPTPIP